MAMPKRSRAPDELQNIPGVGPSLAQALIDLGYCRVPQLRSADPEQMYQKLCMLRGEQNHCGIHKWRMLWRSCLFSEGEPIRGWRSIHRWD